VAVRRSLAALVGMLASAALLGSVCLRHADLWSLESAWRFWDDTAIAIGRYLDWSDTERQSPSQNDGGLKETSALYRHLVKRGAVEAAIHPCEFWKTIPPGPFRHHRQPYSVPALEDPGRAILLATGYVALGGISPYLPIWLGPLACVLVLLWISWELFDAGHATAACVFLLALVCSPYLVDSLILPHSAVGFYLVACLALVALAAYAVLGCSESLLLLLVRVVIAASVFAVCAVCRSSTLFLAPGFVVALTLASARVVGDAQRGPPSAAPRSGRWAGLLITAVLTVAFLLPYLFLRPRQHHNAWVSVWEGLGDYGAKRGYSWYDADARRFLAQQGLTPFDDPKDVRHEHEAVFRRAVLADISAHPFWYAGILGRRIVATATFRKLAPGGPAGGDSLEGPRFHYKYTTPVNWVGVGRWRVELPAWSLWSPLVALALAWLAARLPAVGADVRDRIEGYGTVILCASIGALALPVLLTTAAGIETQAFAFVCFLALAFLVQEFVGLARMGVAKVLGLGAERSASSGRNELRSHGAPSTRTNLELLTNHRRIWKHKPVLADVYLVWFEALLGDLGAHHRRILELGAGPGFLSEYARRQRPQLTWIAADIVEAPWNDLVADALRLPFRSGALDGILALDVLHHLARPRHFFEDAARVLAPGGCLAVVEPWVTPFSYPIYRWLHHEECTLRLDPWQPFGKEGPRSPFDGDAALVWRLIRQTSVADWSRLGFRPPRYNVLNGFGYLASLGFGERTLLPRRLAPTLLDLDTRAVALAPFFGVRVHAIWERGLAT